MPRYEFSPAAFAELFTDPFDAQPDDLPATPPAAPFDFISAEDDDRPLIAEYVRLKIRQREIEERIKELQPRITYLVLDQPREGNQQIARAYGAEFTVQYRKTWRYSDNVLRLEQELKALKRLEEATGAAVLERESAILCMKVMK